MRAVLGAVVVWLTATVTVLAQNTDTAAWSKIGAWQIRVDRTIGDGCFAMASYQRGTVARLGVDVSSNALYILFGHSDWKSLEAGRVYHVRVVFDGVKSYDGEMRGQQLGNMVFLAHRHLSSAFVRDFMDRNGIEVFYRGALLASLSLKDSYAAVKAVMDCQREFGFARSRERTDPFAGASPVNRDPFR